MDIINAMSKPALHGPPLMTATLLSSIAGIPKLAVSLATGEYLKLGQDSTPFSIIAMLLLLPL